MEPKLVGILRSVDNPDGLTAFELIAALETELRSRGNNIKADLVSRNNNRPDWLEIPFDADRDAPIQIQSYLRAADQLAETLKALEPAERLRMVLNGTKGFVY